MTLTPGKLPTSRAFLDRLARKIGDPKDPRRPATDYRLAKVLELTPGAISKIRSRRSTFGNETALKVAALLGEQASYVVACVNYERERSVRVRVIWEAIARAAAVGAVVVVSSVAQALGGTLPAPSSSASSVHQAIHYASRRRPGRRPRRAPYAGPLPPPVRRHGRRAEPQRELRLGLGR